MPRNWGGWAFIIAWGVLIVALVIWGAAEATDCAQLNADFCERVTWE